MAERHTNKMLCLLLVLVRVILRFASAEKLFIIPQKLAEIKLVSWQPQGADNTEQ